MNANLIREALTRAPMGAQPILAPDEAEVRALMLVEDMAFCGIEIEVEAFPVGGGIWVPCYKVPRSDFGQEQTKTPPDVDDSGQGRTETSPPIPDVYTASGSGLTHGDLVRLSKACAVGRRLIPDLWPQRFRKKLHADHLATIQELLWLSRFRTPINIEVEPRPFAGCGKGPDWRFTSNGQTINVEVKYRPGDWIRHVDGPQYSPARPGLFDGVAAKFPSRLPGELNLVALSVIAPIEETLISAADLFLESTKTIDAVLIWTDSPQTGPTTAVRPHPSAFVKVFYNDGDVEDRRHIGRVRHLLRNSAERRNITPAEAPVVIEDLARQEWEDVSS